MGTLKDVPLFENFMTDGEYGGGIIAKSTAGFGHGLRKTKPQVQKIQENLAWSVLLVSNELP